MLKFRKYQDLHEGGGFGHLSNVYDINLTFKEMEKFIHDALKGNLDYVEEKTDAVNLMISYRADKGIIGARNKSHLKNYGENALSPAGIRLKFKSRPLEKAYGNAMDDLQDAIKSLSPAQQEKVFGNGKHWLSLEVMGHGAENIIEYGVRELRLHGTIEHNVNGEQVSGINKEAARMFDGMLRQRGTHEQGSFTIKNLNRVALPKVDDFDKMHKRFVSELNKIMKQHGLKPGDNVEKMKEQAWKKIIHKYAKDVQLVNKLINRWAKFNKSPSITAIKKEHPEDAKWIVQLEKDMKKINKNIMLPLEKLFLGLGAERLKTMSDFMAVNPDATVQKLKAKIDQAVKAVKKSGNPELLNKLEVEMDRLASTGKLLPTEGITFFWNGHFLKLTGSFAPANQIIGILYRI